MTEQTWADYWWSHPHKDRHRFGAELGDAFLDAPDEDGRASVLRLLQEGSTKEPLPVAIAALHILRQLKRPEAVTLVRRIVATWPRDWRLRYTLSNTLFLADAQGFGLEALQQRVIGRSMELFVSRGNQAYGFTPEGASIVGKHLADVDRIRGFLDGRVKYPSKYIGELERGAAARDATKFDENVLAQVMALGVLCCPHNPSVPNLGRTLVVVDTNAIATRELYQWFGHPDLQFIAPPGVLLEFARWDAIQHVPWQFDAVEIRRRQSKVIPEIDEMQSAKKGKVPSDTDKDVAMLALESKAGVIVSGDRDLWDSGMSHAVEKNTGHRIQVFVPRAFANWAQKNFSTTHPSQ